jgi:hypothetical protein
MCVFIYNISRTIFLLYKVIEIIIKYSLIVYAQQDDKRITTYFTIKKI